MYLKANYEESCTCGCTEIKICKTWRIITWYCAKCNKMLAGTILSDSPVSAIYAQKKLYVTSNEKLRKEKGLKPKKTVITFYEENGERVLWKDIVKKNLAWEKKMGNRIQRKPF